MNKNEKFKKIYSIYYHLRYHAIFRFARIFRRKNCYSFREKKIKYASKIRTIHAEYCTEFLGKKLLCN